MGFKAIVLELPNKQFSLSDLDCCIQNQQIVQQLEAIFQNRLGRFRVQNDLGLSGLSELIHRIHQFCRGREGLDQLWQRANHLRVVFLKCPQFLSQKETQQLERLHQLFDRANIFRSHCNCTFPFNRIGYFLLTPTFL
jgi:hypothetical protein